MDSSKLTCVTLDTEHLSIMHGGGDRVRERLEEEGQRARERVAALEREFAGLAEAASAAGTDDEHDPEGATLAFERQHAAALLEAAREQVAAYDAALVRLAAGSYGAWLRAWACRTENPRLRCGFR